MRATRIERAEEYFAKYANDSAPLTAQHLAHFAGNEVSEALREISRVLTEHMNVVDGVQTVIRKYLDGVK